MSYTYPSGRLSGTTLDNVTDTFTYDTYGQLESYTAVYSSGGTPTTLYSYTLTRDNGGRITGKSETVQGTTKAYAYTYDSAGRLTQEAVNGTSSSGFTYDSNSNRTSGTVDGVSFTATYDDQDRILTYNSRTYTHNRNGDLTQIQWNVSQQSQFVYDEMGNLKQVTLPSGTLLEYVHDGLDRRVVKKSGGTFVARWLYEDQHRISAVINGSNAVAKEFVHATRVNVPDYMIVSGVKYRIITDHLGSPRLVVRRDTGAVSQRMDYNVLGEEKSDTNAGFQPFGFAGGLYDSATQLVRFGARDYDPRAGGRWTTKDPIRFNGGDANLYGYVANDPVNWIDPSGLWRWPGAIYDDAMRDARNSGLPGPHNGLQDAYRHCLASCMMTQENGNFLSQLLGDANEKRGDWFHNQESGEKCMDQNNNSRGRDFGRGGGNCSQQCAAAAGNGGLTTYTGGSTPGYWGN